VLSPSEQQQVAAALEEDAQVMSDAHLQELLVDQPSDVQDEILSINADVRPLALQIALGIPILAGLVGAGIALRMRRLPDPVASGAGESVLGG
jgi:hypothetical protein